MGKIYLARTGEELVNKDFQYILGFQPSAGYFFFEKNSLYIFLDSRYYDMGKKIKQSDIHEKLGDIDFQVVLLDKTYKEKFKNIIGEKIIILEKSKIPYKFYEDLKRSITDNIELVDSFFDKYRYFKKSSEIKKLIKAQKITKRIYKDIVFLNEEGVLKGLREIELRRLIISKIFEYGGEAESFPAIVAFGKNSAVPHHISGTTKIENGPLLLDFGAVYKGYCGDFTRTIWVGNKDNREDYDEYMKIYRIAKKAYQKALDAIVVGREVKDLDAIAREYISKMGYGDMFNHSLGHGVGLDAHERPFLSSKSQDVLKSQTLFTLEPGIYLSGKFGVRYENVVYIQDDNNIIEL